MKNLIVIIGICFPAFMFSQKAITGKILNEAGESLPGATVVLLTQIDSTMSSFALTDEQGRFRMDGVKPDNYILQASYISHTSYSQNLETDWSSNNIDAGIINLSESTEILQEITVKAEHIPMGIRGDTISYNANAFKMRPNATVEELLKKLPGIEVERNGNIKAQGENVDNVLVDGKAFFGGDPKMATKNLEADAVDQVDVYDKKSDLAEFTGVDDGDEEKTINLKLKEDHKNGGFGKANIAAGTEDSYHSRMSYFRFSPAMQASVILSANNINEETFTFEDRIEFMGGIANAMSSGGLNFGSYQGMEDGLNESASLGANMNYDFSSKVNLSSHYLYNRVNNMLDQQSYIESITDDFRYDNQDSLVSDKTNASHLINTRLTYKVNPLTELVFQNNLNFKDFNHLRLSQNDYFKEGDYLGYSSSDFTSLSDSWGMDSKTWIKRKFVKKGRSIIGTFTFKKDSNDKSDRVNNLNRVEGNFMDVLQNQAYMNKLKQMSFDVNITEPLSSKIFAGLSYSYGRSEETPERLYYDLENGLEILNEDLSAVYNKLYVFQRAGMNLRRNVKKLKMNLALQGQLTQLDGVINAGEERIDGSYKHLLPSYVMEYEMKGGKSIDLRYHTSVVAPQLDQLMPLPDNTTANFQFVGNPNLVPEYNHRVSLGFHLFDNFNFTSFFANVNTVISNNRIVYRTTIDDNLFRTVEPVNTDKYQETRAFISLSRPFRPLKLKYRLRLSGSRADYDSYINTLKSNVIDENINFRLSVSNRKTDHVLLEAGMELDFSKRKYGIDPEFNQSYQRAQYFMITEAYIKGGWTLTSDLEYTRYSTGTFNDTPSYYLWTVSISKLLFDDKLEIRAAAHDLLNQNIGYRRTGNSQSIRQVEYQTLGQFFIVGLTYRIGKTKDNGDVRIEMD